MSDRRWTNRRYDEIDSVTLETSTPPHSAMIGTCRLAFADTTAVLITSATADSLSDGLRDDEFNDFVADLHRRLAGAGRNRIAFRSTSGRPRRLVVSVVLAVAVGLVVAVPMTLLGLTGRPVWLLALALGILLAVPVAGLATFLLKGAYHPEWPPILLR